MKNSSGTQEQVFAFLADPQAHGGTTPVRFDTHASAIFLAGDRALKLKRAVKFPFLDYSTLAKRKEACEAELAVNRRFAPQIYRRTVAITRDANGALAIGGSGEPVEWAVEMLRFDENQTLDHVADEGAFDDALSLKLARKVAAMHEGAAPASADAWISALAEYIAQNSAAFRDHEDLFPSAEVDAFDAASRSALGRLEPLLRSRGRMGLIRHGHGDLHLGNIALIDEEPVAFDAIEFDPVIASGDVLYDLAFLLMDLVERGLVQPANVVLNGYFSAARRMADCDGLAALAFFMSLRSAIRAKVTAARLGSGAARRSAIALSAVRYFNLARELLEPSSPRLICVGGLSGTGKSVLARDLAPLITPPPGALVLRSDAERKAMFGVAETVRLREDAYRPELSGRLYAFLAEKAGRIVRAGHPVIVDAVFSKPSEREAMEAAAKAAGAPFHGIFLVTDIETRLRRIGTRVNDASDADAAVARLQEGSSLGRMSWNVVDASGTPADTLKGAHSCCESLFSLSTRASGSA